MPLTLTADQLTLVANAPDDTAVVDVPLYQNELEGAPVDEDFMSAAGFEAKCGQTLLVPSEEGPRLLVGLGEADDLDIAKVRKAAGASRSAAKSFGSLTTHIASVAAGRLGTEAVAGAVVQGVLLSSYRFDELRGEPPDADVLAGVIVATSAGEGVAEEAATVAAGIALTRDLVNRPGGTLRAVDLAEAATAAADEAGIDIEVWDLERCRDERLGGILAVNAGSTHEPRLVKMTYEPDGGSDTTIVFVGKGITFDTGGLSLKSGEGMMGMKTDMGGAAAVVGAMRAIRTASPAVRVVGICCCTDNQPGPEAIMPGDVFAARNGKTVEVLNTDAEGRLVLADGLSLAVEMAPAAIIDLATLTGACLVALGGDIAGLMGSDDDLIERVKSAAATAGDEMWHLPLPAQYRKQLDSTVADLKNIGTGRWGGTLTAGLFLKEFTGDVPWVHLDIAGPVTTEDASGEYTKGATGFAVRTLLEVAGGF
ncbi:MAG: leucyl aminopeptidase [Actinomycetota bacterium]|jgi:leucyl aminopeptidase|nr:leucyl aminopeptidase [Actinomycetota bacterium]